MRETGAKKPICRQSPQRWSRMIPPKLVCHCGVKGGAVLDMLWRKALWDW